MSHRPATFDKVIGQNRIKSRLAVSIQAAKMSGQPLGHVLIDGPAGLGKTTFAGCIAHALQVPMMMGNATTIDNPSMMLDAICNIPRNGIIYIDEIHNLPRLSQELLYAILEDFRLPDSSMSIMEIQPFTLIGTTTHTGKLMPAFVDRFKNRCTLEYYTGEELAQIISPLFQIDWAAAVAIGNVSRGVPRIAIRHAEWVRDWCLVNGVGVYQEHVGPALEAIGIDSKGLGPNDRLYLETLRRSFQGGPAGAAALAASMNVAQETIEGDIEPYLLRQGYIVRTPRGRQLNQFQGFIVRNPE
jgi:Holliday junction DNA helicase RuvB